jgi:(1->4)-alpha-D-glucan 1-alpha-D-glucosylmutase
MPRQRRATYRLQLNPAFGFVAAESRLGYFAKLGVSHLYLSPITQAAKGSTHGYDLTDPTVISDDLGGADAFRSLSRRAAELDIGLLIDIVTNHMAADAERNLWWRDVLERGRASSYASFFDIDWEVSTAGDLSYRRFFDINSLVAVCSQHQDVFNAFHELPKKLLDEGLIDGIRVDHIDGLDSPHTYLRRLRALLRADAWIVVEKILASDEELPQSWDVDGSTGYEFGADVTALLTDEAGKLQLSNIYAQWVGEQDLESVAITSRRQAATMLLQPELARTARQFAALDDLQPKGDVVATIADLAARMKVYRIYADDPAMAERAKQRITAALKLLPADTDRALAQSVVATLTEGKSESSLAFATRFSQLSSAVAAKGIEDTAFYRYLQFTPHCEVGYDLDRFSIDDSAFLSRSASRADLWPTTLLGDSTHDSKRSADVRARLLVLAQIPGHWGKAVSRWRDIVAEVNLDPATQYLFFQSLVGAWPISSERLTAYMVKACREAKRHTSWVAPDGTYEATLARFVESALGNGAFIREFTEFLEEIIPFGRLTSFIQTVLKLTLPGVPDIYQGDERWALSLVDPDNRRPVDFESLADGLSQHDASSAIPDPRTDVDGVSKQLLIHRVLALRKDQPELFHTSLHLRAMRSSEDDLLAFIRGDNMVVVTSLFASRTALQADLEAALPAGTWMNILRRTSHQGTQTFTSLCGSLPSAIMIRKG